jgi:hypothetical protein
MRKALFAALVVTLCTASAAQAQATRTWVSGVGDDINPCSRIAPCKTFAGAISKTADPGEIDALDPGGFGAVTITKSMTIDGGGTMASILSSGVNGVIINAPGEKVFLRRLSINGAGVVLGINAIRVIAVGELHVEDCVIANFSQRGIDFSAGGGSLYVSNVTIGNVGNAAIYVGNARAAIDHVISTGNQTGVLSAGSSVVTVKNSVLSGGNTGVAAAYGPTAQVNVEDCVITNNDFGVVAGQAAIARLSSTVVMNNSNGLYTDGASFVVSFGNNRITANGVDGAFTSTVALR